MLPQPGELIGHPNVVAIPHLGASTVEAQENASTDVCTQVLGILSGQPLRSAANAPIILPEEYRSLQLFVTLLQKMGSLYTQHLSPSNTARCVRTRFDIIYGGTLASANTAKPLFAALVNGLVTPVTARKASASTSWT